MLFYSFLEIVLTIFSCLVLSYVSISTSMGPWIFPVIMIFLHFVFSKNINLSKEEKSKKLCLMQVSGSLAGLVATAVGFTLPTLFFLDSSFFQTLISNFVYFNFWIGSIVFFAGILGTFAAKAFSEKILTNKAFKFPISELIKSTSNEIETKTDWNLPSGIAFSSVFLTLRDGFNFANKFKVPPLIGSKIVPGALSSLSLGLFPTMWAIGFTAGLGIVLPLFIGFLSRFLILYPINNHAYFFKTSFFPVTSELNFSFSFCAGIILFELIFSIFKYGLHLKDQLQKEIPVLDFSQTINELKLFIKPELVFAFICNMVLSVFIGLSFLQAIFLNLGAIFISFELSKFSSRAGIAPFGRFVTFLMLPAMFFFNLTNYLIVFLCIFTAVSSAAAVSLIFQFKVAELKNISKKEVLKKQLLGLFLTSISIGLFLWILFKSFKLGSSDLFAQRGYFRALLINSPNLIKIPIFFGVVFSAVLHYFKFSATMVLGGIIMPKELITALLFGSAISGVTKNSKKIKNFFVGVLAGESIFIILSLALKLL